jgi:hypothetical protein
MIEGAGWHPDPSRRHEYRYWDGSTWTDFVADRGVVIVDPLIAAGTSQPVTGEPTWVVVLALLLFFPIGLMLVWREPWRQSAKVGITVAVAILVLGGGVASAIALRDRTETATTPQALDHPVPRTVPTTTAPPRPATPTQAFLRAIHDPRAGALAAESDASLLDLGRTGCNALKAGLAPSLLSSTMHTQEPDITLAQARYFVASIRLLCPAH